MSCVSTSNIPFHDKAGVIVCESNWDPLAILLINNYLLATRGLPIVLRSLGPNENVVDVYTLPTFPQKSEAYSEVKPI
jgi:hypothetical protein